MRERAIGALRYLARGADRLWGSSQFSSGRIFAMLLPIILDTFFVSAIGILTTAMISTSSQESVAAVSVVGPISMMIYAIISALSTGGTVVVARFVGEGKRDKIKEAAGQVVTAVTLLSLAMAVVVIVFAHPLIGLLYGEADPVVVQKAGEYLTGVAVSMVFLAIYMGATAVFRGMGENRLCLLMTIVINLSYFLFSVLFLNVLKLDILGTSLAVNLARALGAAAAMWELLRRRGVLGVPPRALLRLDLSLVRSLSQIGVPYATEQIFFNAGSMIVQIFLVALGTVSITANAVANNFMGVVYAAGQAVCTLSMTVVGQCLGAGRTREARRYGRSLCVLATILMAVSLAVFIPLMPFILRLYQAPDNTVSLIRRLIYLVVAPLILFWPVSNVIPCVLRAGSDSLYCSVSSLLIMWAVRVGLGYTLTVLLGVGVEGLWLAMGAEMAVRALFYWRRFKKGRWLTLSQPSPK